MTVLLVSSVLSNCFFCSAFFNLILFFERDRFLHLREGYMSYLELGIIACQVLFSGTSFFGSVWTCLQDERTIFTRLSPFSVGAFEVNLFTVPCRF